MNSLKLILLLVLITSCSKKERTVPKISSITESVYASGMVKAEKQYQVFPDVSGILRKKHIVIGQEVKKDDVIFTIDNVGAEYVSDNAALNVIKSRENLIKVTELERQTELLRNQFLQDSMMYIRQQNLWKQNIGSKMELENRRLAAHSSRINFLNSLTTLRNARVAFNADYKTAANNLKIAKEEAANYEVRSEVDGKVFTIYPEEGELVTPQTLLAVVGKPDRFLIEMQVDENDIGKIRSGQQIFITMESYGDTVFKATVSKIHPIMDERSGTFTVEGLFTKPPFRLFPNLTLEANILISQKKDVLIIPREFLIDDKFVLVDRERKVPVKVGLKNFESAEIVEGITKDDYIYKP